MYSQVLLATVAAAIVHLSCSALDRRDPLERIIGGADAEPKQFPYQIFFETLIPFLGWKRECGGTIISKRIILTAAHCVTDLTDDFTHLQIYFGAVNISNTNEKGQQRLIVDKSHVTVHEEYISHPFTINDIALIKLPVDLQFNDYIQPAKMPSDKFDYVDKAAVATGWGYVKYDDDGRIKTDTLQQLNVTIISNKACKELFHKDIPGKFFTTSFICLGPTDGSPCKGDSGGSLVLLDGSRTLIGITSHGIACDRYKPGIYTRVSSYLDWIAEHAGAEILYGEY